MLCSRLGYALPMLFGFVVTLFSIVGFALARSFTTLLAARALQGLGSAFTAAAGMGMLAQAYADDDAQRGRAMGRALAGVSVGLMAGPPFGGLLYARGGILLPFGVLGLLALLAIGGGFFA